MDRRMMTELHLGTRLEWNGRMGTVDALSQSFVALRMDDGDYLLVGWK